MRRESGLAGADCSGARRAPPTNSRTGPTAAGSTRVDSSRLGAVEAFTPCSRPPDPRRRPRSAVLARRQPEGLPGARGPGTRAGLPGREHARAGSDLPHAEGLQTQWVHAARVSGDVAGPCRQDGCDAGRRRVLRLPDAGRVPRSRGARPERPKNGRGDPSARPGSKRGGARCGVGERLRAGPSAVGESSRRGLARAMADRYRRPSRNFATSCSS